MTGERTYADRVARAQIVLGSIAVAVGVVGLLMARSLDLTEPTGKIIALNDYELKLMAYNPLGALVTIGVGGLGIFAGITRRTVLAMVAAVGGALMALQVVVQWRTEGDNLLGGTGRNLGFGLFLAAGFATTAALARLAPRIDERTPTAAPS